MSWCKTCGNFKMFDSHLCPPAFKCLPEGETYEETIYARDAETAAEKYAEQFDSEYDYSILRGTAMRMQVTSPDGEVSYFEVTGESVPEYSASGIEAPSGVETTQIGSTVGESPVGAAETPTPSDPNHHSSR
jgi:hypothetical protein